MCAQVIKSYCVRQKIGDIDPNVIDTFQIVLYVANVLNFQTTARCNIIALDFEDKARQLIDQYQLKI